MQINSIKSISPNTSFKSHITFDIGGSQREGSCKIYYATSDDDKEIYTAKTIVNTLGKNQFEDSNDFIEQIMEKTRIVQENNRGNVRDLGYPDDESTIRSITIFIPSYTDKRSAYYLPNHRNTENRPLKDLDFSDVESILTQKGVKIAPNMEFRLLQDAMGTGLAMTKKLYDLGMLPVGSYYTACITGGGCGIADIRRVADDFIVIESSGSGCLPTGDKLEKVSKAGASAPAVIENFCKPFGMNEELVEDIKSCHKAEFTLSNPITYKKFKRNIKTKELEADVKAAELKELLLSTGKYEVIAENNNEFTLSVKPEFLNLYNECRDNAIEKYCQAFARLASQLRNRCSNGLVITGPLARAINKVASEPIEKDGEKIEQYGKKISERVMKHLFGSYNTYELEKAQKTYGFKVMCDDRFYIDDNTACKKLAHQTIPIAPDRGNWIRIPVKALQDMPSND